MATDVLMPQMGESIAEGGFRSIAGLDPDEILMPYGDA